MLSVLIDNSTLTATQRLIGDVPVARSFPVEGDLLAFDQYLQSLLIYDNVAAIDDYKPEYKISRSTSFKEVRFITTEQVPYQSSIDLATKHVSDLSFEIRKGSIASGPLNDLLRSLDLHVSPAWYMQSSEWFLRMRLIADESDIDLPKYGILMSTIKDQAREMRKSCDDSTYPLKIEDRRGKSLDLQKTGDGSVEEDIKSFATSLNWIAHRSLFYLALSNHLQCALALHPIRHRYLAQGMISPDNDIISSNARSELLKFFESSISPIRDSSDAMLGLGAFRQKLPFFAAWAVGFAGNPRQAHDHVLQIRSSPPCTKLRAHFREIEDTLASGATLTARSTLAKLRAAISDDINQLAVKFEGKTPNPGIGLSINALTLSPSISAPSVINRVRAILPSKARKSSAIFRNIATEILEFHSFGTLRDKFSLSRKYHKGTGYVSDRTRTELSRYKYSTSSIKRPL